MTRCLIATKVRHNLSDFDCMHAVIFNTLGPRNECLENAQWFQSLKEPLSPALFMHAFSPEVSSLLETLILSSLIPPELDIWPALVSERDFNMASGGFSIFRQPSDS